MSTVISTRTTGGGGLSVTGDASGILQLASADGTTAVTIDASQNVGIGTSSPAGYKLNVQGGDVNLTGSFYAKSQNYFGATNAGVSMQHYTNVNWNYSNLNLWRNATNTSTPRFLGMPLDGDSEANTTIGGFNAIWGAYDSTPTTGSTSSGLNGKIVYGAYAGHQWYTNGTERMRIDSSGNVLVGATSAYSATQDRLTVTHNQNDINRLVIDNQNAGASTKSSLGLYSFGASWEIASGSTANNNNALTFVNNSVERMRIDSSGSLLLGASSGLSGKFRVFNAVNSDYAISAQSTTSGDVNQAQVVIYKYDNNTTTTQLFQRYIINNGGNGSGQINANGAGAAAFGTYSDSRLKENIIPLPPQLDNILALRPVEFDYKTGGHQIGFIAQEMQTIYPDVVAEDNTEEKMLSISGWDKTTARLVAAIQELKAIIDTQQTQITTLNAKVGI